MIDPPYFQQEPYLSQIRIKLMQQLIARYPYSRHALGAQKFRQYAIASIHRAWPSTGNLLDYGEHFIEALQEAHEEIWCVDLARLDWALGCLPSALEPIPFHPAWVHGMTILCSHYDLLHPEDLPLGKRAKLSYFWCVPWWPIPLMRIQAQDAAWLQCLDGTRSLRRLMAQDRTGSAKRLLGSFVTQNKTT